MVWFPNLSRNQCALVSVLGGRAFWKGEGAKRALLKLTPRCCGQMFFHRHYAQAQGTALSTRPYIYKMYTYYKERCSVQSRAVLRGPNVCNLVLGGLKPVTSIQLFLGDMKCDMIQKCDMIILGLFIYSFKCINFNNLLILILFYYLIKLNGSFICLNNIYRYFFISDVGTTKAKKC